MEIHDDHTFVSFSSLFEYFVVCVMMGTIYIYIGKSEFTIIRFSSFLSFSFSFNFLFFFFSLIDDFKQEVVTNH